MRAMRPRMLLATGLVMVSMTGCTLAGTPSSDFIEIPGVGRTRIDVPRPDSGGPDCALAFPAATSTVERVTALRAAGLFADTPALTDQMLADRIDRRIAEWWGESPSPSDPLHELMVAEQDVARVWWHDLEADVGEGGQVYVTTLREWAAISEGAFRPTDITETWASWDGPVSVTFTLDGTTHTLSPASLEDWIDPGILVPINELITASGRRFEMVAAFDQSGVVLALTPAERVALEARGWCFT